MERVSLSSLTYNGSIPEAINKAKKQKKLFVVYISGEDCQSKNLENKTWTDMRVAESVLKYCVLLHIREGSTDAANFCAIYPQNSIPCIKAIGHNGLQVWESEGFVSAEELASSFEKAWVSLHIQEATASVLTAALASKKSVPTTSETSLGSSQQGSSLGAAVPPSSLEKHLQSSSDARTLITSEMESHTESDTSSKSLSGSQPGDLGNEHSISSSEGVDNSRSPTAADIKLSQADYLPNSIVVHPAPSGTSGHHSSLPTGHTLVTPVEVNDVVKSERVDDVGEEDINISGSTGRVSESTDVNLNIRLPNGVSLQEKFSLTSALVVVKDFVDRNLTDMSSYDLAIPYPRKIFSDEDLSKSLSDLRLCNRQALLVVPRRASGYHGGGSLMSEQTSSSAIADSANVSEGGYLSYIRRLISYANPFSYFSSGVSSSGQGQDSQTGIWEYGPNTLQTELAGGDRPNHGTSSGRNTSKNRPPTTSQYGSNIHTLKRDEDDKQFSDRNVFWNGNSTQFGGDSNGR